MLIGQQKYRFCVLELLPEVPPHAFHVDLLTLSKALQVFTGLSGKITATELQTSISACRWFLRFVINICGNID